MNYPISGEEFIAPRCFVATKMKDKLQGISNYLDAWDWLTLDEGTTLAAFTINGRCRNFVRTYFGGEDGSILPRPLSRSIFTLAEVLEYLEGVEYVAIDPTATAPGAWSHSQQAMTASYCCRLAREMYPGLDKLFSEAAAQVRDWANDPAQLQKVKDICAPRIDEVIENARARSAEWEVTGI